MRKQLFLLLTVLIAGSCVLGAPKKKTSKKPLPVWKPAPALLKQLAEQSDLPFGTIRLPRGYEFFDFPVAFEAGTALSWAKKSTTGEANHIFLVGQIPYEELGWKNLSLEAMLSEYMKGYFKNFAGTRRTPAKQGLINRVRTLQTDWSGTSRATRVKMQGTVFMMKDATDVYIIQTGHWMNDLAEKHRTEAAALTFKIQSQQ